MVNRLCFRSGCILTVTLLCLSVTGAVSAKEKDIDICSLVSAEQLAGIYKKELFPTAQRRSCFWSEERGAMAYLQIGYHQQKKDLRTHFHEKLPSHVKLEEIKDLGDGGLMGVTRGHLETIVIKKKKRVLKSTVTFLDIEQGSREHKQLWEIYSTILEEL